MPSATAAQAAAERGWTAYGVCLQLFSDPHSMCRPAALARYDLAEQPEIFDWMRIGGRL
jgi:hypothetical protein